jgi:hypothetical protein
MTWLALMNAVNIRAHAAKSFLPMVQGPVEPIETLSQGARAWLESCRALEEPET